MSGYSLQQLLSWCVADHLIDSFAIRGDTVLLFKDKHGVKLPSSEAQNYLITLIRQNTADLRQRRRQNTA